MAADDEHHPRTGRRAPAPHARVLLACVVALTAACGRGPFADRTAERVPDSAPRWGVGACLRQTAGPTEIPPDVTGDKRQVLELSRQYDTVACGDERALAEITAAGARIEFLTRPTDDGCPPDTDLAVKATSEIQLDQQIWCARNRRPPHPGDPGGGGGGLVAGDCVHVVGTNGGPAIAAQVVEMPCTAAGWFAAVAALAPEAAACPPVALSRLPSPSRPGEVVCLAPSGPTGRGDMAEPGECLAESPYASGGLAPARRGDCAGPGAVRVTAFADDAGRCADRSKPYRATGYDRMLCLARP